MSDQLPGDVINAPEVGTYTPPPGISFPTPSTPLEMYRIPRDRRLWLMVAFSLAVAIAAAVMLWRWQAASNAEPIVMPPAVVYSPVALSGAVVVARAPVRTLRSRERAHVGERIAVRVTEYCLQGTTRRGRWVRPGIVAADPKVFPLSRYIELFVGHKYWGRFLVDDTGKRIIGARIDVWEGSCRLARRFGIEKGEAILVGR